MAQSSDPQHQLGEHTEHMPGSYIMSDQNPQIWKNGMHMTTVVSKPVTLKFGEREMVHIQPMRPTPCIEPHELLMRPATSGFGAGLRGSYKVQTHRMHSTILRFNILYYHRAIKFLPGV